ncbi:MAG: 1-deoxy-D-xylulose-5-phosphate reductoisomerase [Verrucomicrobia bacterium]|nr:1-deoxy-D-xylulose-5-phosphate reductoisomerase [Verrucomicrobiota bacterium]
MKRIGILGSTGSIGKAALQVIQHLGDHLQVTALAAKSNIELLEQQARMFRPEIVAVWDEEKAKELQKRLPEIEVLGGLEGVSAVATHGSVDLLLSAIAGFEGVLPTLRAIEAKKNIALANKEALVAAGKLVLDLVKKHGVDLIPVDSEHTAILQCLKGEEEKKIRRIILTASGGPFRDIAGEKLKSITIADALAHPNYLMGPKVTIDSSTMMNKGLEMIETHYFYGVSIEQIEVVIHPEQIVHSMVEFSDRSIMAQMGEPNMLVPIQVALTHPDRMEGILTPFDFTQAHKMHFAPWDQDKYRCLKLAYYSLRVGGSMPCFMNAANEVLVGRFLGREIGWMDISQKLETLMEKHQVATPQNYEDFASIDLQARDLAKRI